MMMPPMTDIQIERTVRLIRRLWLEPRRTAFLAIAEGLVCALEDAGVTPADLDRLGL